MRSLRRARSGSRRNPLGAIATLAAIAVLTIIVALVLPPSPALVGEASAVDGDTLRLGGERIRIAGFDAVELDQTCSRDGAVWPCGREARDFVQGLVRSAETSCAVEGRDQYRRALARCTTAGRDLGDAIVRAGWATADLEYAVAEADARLNRRGIWSSRFDEPARWRADQGAPSNFWAWLMGLFGD